MTEPSDSTDKPVVPGDSAEASPPQQPAPGSYAPYGPQGYPTAEGYPPQGYPSGAIRRGRIRGPTRRLPVPGTRHRRHSRTRVTAPHRLPHRKTGWASQRSSPASFPCPPRSPSSAGSSSRSSPSSWDSSDIAGPAPVKPPTAEWRSAASSWAYSDHPERGAHRRRCLGLQPVRWPRLGGLHAAGRRQPGRPATMRGTVPGQPGGPPSASR